MSSAQVRNNAALDELHVSLVDFQASSKQALEMLQVEARRGMDWVVTDRARFWKQENRASWDGLHQAKEAFHQARIQRTVADRVPDCIDEKKMIQRAEARLKTSEAKLKAIQHWSREVQHAWNEFQSRVAQTLAMLDGDLPRSLTLLEKIRQHLQLYFTMQAPRHERQETAANGAESEASDGLMTKPMDNEANSVAINDELSPDSELQQQLLKMLESEEPLANDVAETLLLAKQEQHGQQQQ